MAEEELEEFRVSILLFFSGKLPSVISSLRAESEEFPRREIQTQCILLRKLLPLYVFF